MTEPVGAARYFPWDGGAVFVGTAGVLPSHAHQAIQICFLFDGRIRLRTTNDDPWTDYDVAIVPSRHRHAMDGGKIHFGATLFVEPETREGRILTERYLQHGLAALERSAVDAVMAALRAAAIERRDAGTIVERARALVQALTEHTEPAVTSDERILRAVRFINERLSAPITLAQVAQVAFLSPSRFRHLFAEQTGMRLREYVLWRRFVSVWEHRMSGATLAEAAHAAGFADSAHLARTSRRMFGIPPSALELSTAAPPRDRERSSQSGAAA
jgi:AraC family transcriptional regulator